MVDDDGEWEVVGGTRFLVAPSQAWLDAQAAIVDEPSAFDVARDALFAAAMQVSDPADIGKAIALGSQITAHASELTAAAPSVVDPAAQTVAQVVADAADAAAS